MNKTGTLTWATGMLLASTGAAHAAGISDDVIRIGFLTDISGVYADYDGQGGVQAIRMAIRDAGGSIDGKKIELLYADHQNKADVAAAKSREWVDVNKVDILIGGTNSAVSLAMANVATEKKKLFISTGGGTSALTGKQCSPYIIHYTYSTDALANGTGKSVVKNGGKDWFFITTDYAFGHALEAATSKVVRQANGTIKGSVKVPLGASDFSSYILQAQSSGAKILGMANAGGDFVNAAKSANEFGLNTQMNLVGLTVLIPDIHSLGLQVTQGMYLTTPFYWDLDDDTRKWTAEYKKITNRIPTYIQAGTYSAVSNYLAAVAALKTDDADAIMKRFKTERIKDFFAKDAIVRADGRLTNPMYLMQVKKPDESKAPWDYYRKVETLSPDDLYGKLEDSACKLVQQSAGAQS